MDKKKFIGTIVGVIFFVALIAGATFAWLTFNANVNNGNYAGSTLNFTYNYTTGNKVESINILSATPARNAITAGAGYVALTASKPDGTAKASKFDLILKKTDVKLKDSNLEPINDSNVVRYAVCKSTTAANCNNSVSTAIPSTTNDTWVALGTITTGTGDQLLYSDKDDPNTTNINEGSFSVEGAATAYYYIYFWVNGDAITSANQDKVIGKSFAGYIYATSEQTD